VIAQVASGSQISVVPVKVSAAPVQTVGLEAGSPFADLVQHLISEHAAPQPAAHGQSVARAVVPQTVVPPTVVPPAPLVVEPAAAAAPVVAPVSDQAEPQAVAAPVPVSTPKVQVADSPVDLSPALKAAEAATPLVVSGTVRPQRKSDVGKTIASAPVAVAVVVPEAISPRLPKPSVQVSEGAGHAAAEPVEAAAAHDDAPAVVDLAAPAAVELKIRAQETQAVTATTQSTEAVAVKTVPVTLPVPMPVPAAQTTETVVAPPVLATPVVVTQAAHAQPPQTVAAKFQSPPAASDSQIEEPLVEEPKTQAVKAVSIEFTPDGAQDVRLRLSERGGDVHISLHSTDSSLSGRLNDGVKDLVHSLTTAGYDAQTWTPGQGRQNQRQAEEPRKTRRNGSDDPDAESFVGVMENPSTVTG
jgi:hypothetical protein